MSRRARQAATCAIFLGGVNSIAREGGQVREVRWKEAADAAAQSRWGAAGPTGRGDGEARTYRLDDIRGGAGSGEPAKIIDHRAG